MLDPGSRGSEKRFLFVPRRTSLIVAGKRRIFRPIQSPVIHLLEIWQIQWDAVEPVQSLFIEAQESMFSVLPDRSSKFEKTPCSTTSLPCTTSQSV